MRMERFLLRRTRSKTDGEVIFIIISMKDMKGVLLWEELCNSEEGRNYSFYCLIRKEEVVIDLEKMKHRKAVGPDDIPIEVWKVLGDTGITWLTDLFNRILKTKKMPN